MCLPELGRVCVWCQNRPAPETVEEADGLKFDPGEFAKSGEISRSLANYLANSDCPWNPDELPEHLRGLGYRGADQDGYDGEGLVGDRGACLGAGGVEIGDVLDLKKKKRN